MLTYQQKRALDCIAGYVSAKGKAPSVREVMGHMKCKGVSNTHRIVECLVERGFLRHRRYTRRGIEIVRLPGEPPSAQRVLYFRFDDATKTLALFTPGQMAEASASSAAPVEPAAAMERAS